MAKPPPPDTRRPPDAAPSRRQFVSVVISGAVVGASCAASPRAGAVANSTGGSPPPPRPVAASHPVHKAASDRVVLGSTGIETSRLALGSGSRGYGGNSDQTRLGLTGFSRLLTQGFDQGATFFETADQYGSHPHVREAVRQVGRQKVTILTKSHAETAAEMRADLDRFRKELGTDMIDIVLLHNKQSPTWTDDCAGAMEALARAKESGAVRAHGVSCHTLAALRLAARTPWVDVDLARINPAGVEMDSDPTTVIEVLRQMKAAGKGVIGMKILGQGKLARDLDGALRHAVALDCVDAFTIGFTSRAQMDEVVKKIAAA